MCDVFELETAKTVQSYISDIYPPTWLPLQIFVTTVCDSKNQQEANECIQIERPSNL